MLIAPSCKLPEYEEHIALLQALLAFLHARIEVMKLVYPMLWSRLARDADREQAINTAAALARRGDEVTVLLPQLSGDPPLDSAALREYFDVTGEFRTVQLPARWAGTPAIPSLLWLRKVLRSPEIRGADLLFSRIPAMLAVGGASPIRFVTDHYRPWPDDLPVLRSLIGRTAFQPHCLGILTHSDFAAESYRRCGVPEGKLLVAHNGADLSRFEPALTRAEARRAIGLEPDRPTAVYAGRINEQKGLDQVGELRERIEALAGTARDKATEMAGEVEKQATKAWNKVEGNVDDTVNAAFARVGVPTRDEIARLTRRIEELTRQVEKKKILGRGKKAVGRRAPAKRRTSARKAG